MPIAPRTLNRKLYLYNKVHNPPQCKHLAEVEQAFIDWEAELEVFKLAGGTEPPEEEKCLIALKHLPLDTPSSLMLPLRNLRAYDALKAVIEEQILYLQETRGLGSGRAAQTHLAADGEAQNAEEALTAAAEQDEEVDEAAVYATLTAE